MAETSQVREFNQDEELDALLVSFRAAAIPNDEWTHRDHLAIAALFIGEGLGLEEVREGIQRLNAANGIEQTLERGYHETITRAWMLLLAEFLSGLPVEMSRLTRIQNVLGEFGDKRYLLRYYSRERIMSADARYGWIEPDLEAFRT
jgi:hypothetical protein